MQVLPKPFGENVGGGEKFSSYFTHRSFAHKLEFGSGVGPVREILMQLAISGILPGLEKKKKGLGSVLLTWMMFCVKKSKSFKHNWARAFYFH